MITYGWKGWCFEHSVSWLRVCLSTDGAKNDGIVFIWYVGVNLYIYIYIYIYIHIYIYNYIIELYIYNYIYDYI